MAAVHGSEDLPFIEKDHVYEIETELSDLDENGCLKPYACQSLFARIAESHLHLLGLEVATTLKYNLAWALVSMSLAFPKPVDGRMKLFAQTWHSERRGPYFRRELVFHDATGALRFHGSTFSVLLDVTTRSVYRKKTLPFPVHPPIEEFTLIATPTLKLNPEWEIIDQRNVQNSHLDCLGHVNNGRYGEFAHDALTAEECLNLSRLARMDIQFVSELTRGDVFNILKGTEQMATGERICIRGMNMSDGRTAFDVGMTFDNLETV